MYIRDLTKLTLQVKDPDNDPRRASEPVIAVGWLNDHVEHPGVLSTELVDRLWQAYKQCWMMPCGGPGFGFHMCEVCELERPHEEHESDKLVEWGGEKLSISCMGYFVVAYGGVLYVYPQLLLHYLLDHDYRPPQEFERAVLNGFFVERDLWHYLYEEVDSEWVFEILERERE